MAGTPTLKNGPITGIVAAGAATGSFTPTALALVIVVWTVTGSATATGARTAANISSTISGMGAWTMQQRSAPGATSQSAVYIGYAFAGASPSAGTVTLTLAAAPTDAQVSVIEITGVSTSTPVVGVVTNAGTAVSFNETFTGGQVPVAADVLFAASCSRNDAAAIGGTGFNVLVNATKASPSASQCVEYKTGVTQTNADISGLNTVHNTFVAFIVKDAGGGGAVPKHKIHTGAGMTDSIRKTYNGSTWTETVSSIR